MRNLIVFLLLLFIACKPNPNNCELYLTSIDVFYGNNKWNKAVISRQYENYFISPDKETFQKYIYPSLNNYFNETEIKVIRKMLVEDYTKEQLYQCSNKKLIFVEKSRATSIIEENNHVSIQKMDSLIDAGNFDFEARNIFFIAKPIKINNYVIVQISRLYKAHMNEVSYLLLFEVKNGKSFFKERLFSVAA